MGLMLLHVLVEVVDFILQEQQILIILSPEEVDSSRGVQVLVQHQHIHLHINAEVLEVEQQEIMLEVVTHFPAMVVVTVEEAEIVQTLSIQEKLVVLLMEGQISLIIQEPPEIPEMGR